MSRLTTVDDKIRFPGTGRPKGDGGRGLHRQGRAQGDDQRALKHYEQALKITRKIGNKRSEGINLGNIGEVYLKSDEN